MKSIADFIVELASAAQDLATLSEGEKLRLLGRAYVTIRDGWRVLGEPASLEGSAEAMDLTQAGGMPVHLYDDEMKAIPLEAAKVIWEIETAITAKGGIEPPTASATKDR
ncbi:hypothetical protein MUO32_28005 [Shinella sp. CPCC 101442]|uniref:hypothetical protein n=1 Tax=Shinella sp. CPCC 101442 TaxID=2932265 RepID=UPI0021524892|nr:hypothetical protein [Shinella sp. CPCC 101442]MCR6502874.1 hypothetical protein [Shinella sp. CPCC 101442]